MDKTPFPNLTESEAANIAAILTAAACSMLSADNDQAYALRESRHIFEEQYKFVQKAQWVAAPGLQGEELE